MERRGARRPIDHGIRIPQQDLTLAHDVPARRSAIGFYL